VEWNKAEIGVVWAVARDYAQKNGLRVPTLKEIEETEVQASGHCDYGTKWAFGVRDLLERSKEHATG